MTPVWIAALCGALIALAFLVAASYRKVGPNRVLIVSGRASRMRDASGAEHSRSFSVFHGGGTFVVPLKEKVDVLSVELMTLEIRTPEFFTKFGVPIVVDGIAQIKVRSDDPLAVATAAEMFLGKSQKEMNEIAHQMMQGHLRAVISTLAFEEIHANPEAFAQNVQRLTAADLATMGIQVVSFTIREVLDPSGFLQAIGRPQLADVQKNAVLGEAAADRDATMGKAAATREAKVCAAEALRVARLAQIDAERIVSRAEAAQEQQRHELSSTLAEQKAASDLAYELAETKEKRKIAAQQLELETLTIKLAEKSLEETVQMPAEAERRRIVILSDATRTQRLSEAEADAASTRLRGEVEADMIRLRGIAEATGTRELALAEADGLRARLEAEADGMRRKADAWKQYNAAAMGQLMIEKMPEVAAAVAAPLANVERIVLVGNGGGDSGIARITQGVTDVVAQVPALMETMGGVRFDELLASLPRIGASAPSASAPGALPTETASSAHARESEPRPVHGHASEPERPAQTADLEGAPAE